MGVRRTADFSEVKELVRDLETAGHRVDGEMRSIMKRGAVEIKKGMRKDFRGHEYLPGVPFAINFDGGGFGGDIEYEIGVDKRGDQGELGNILAYGDGVHGPHVDHTASLRREAPIVERLIAEAGEDAPLGRLR